MKTMMVGMKTVLVIASLLLASVALAQPYPYIEWTRTYGGTGDDVGKSIQITEDGGYIIGGYTNSFGAQGYDMYLIRTDEWGDTLWTRRYGGPFDQSCNSIQITQDGGYILGGYNRRSASGPYELYIIKTDNVGNMSWERIYSEYTGANSLNPTNDGGYIIAGGSYIMKINANGDSLWTRTVNGSALCAKQTNDGGYLVVGYAGVATYLTYAQATKFNSSGTIQWANQYYHENQHGSNYGSWNIVRDFVQDANNNFYLVGDCGGWDSSTPWYYLWYDYMYLLYINAYGTQLGHGNQGHGEDFAMAYSICTTQNGGYTIAGGWSPYQMWGGQWDPFHYYVIKRSNPSTEAWAASYEGIQPNAITEAYDIEQTSDRGYVILGITNNDVYLVKTGPDEPVIRPNIEVSPTTLNFGNVPAGTQTSLPLTIRSNGDTTLTIWGVTTDDSCYTTNFNPAGGLIESGDSLVVSVFFTPEVAIAYNNKHLSINNNDEQVTVTLNGVGTSCISTSSDTLNFGIIHHGIQSVIPLTMHNNCGFVISVRALNSSCPDFFTDFDPADSLMLPQDSLIVSVFFCPQDSAVYNETLTILSSNGTNEVHLGGVGIPSILASPYELSFGTVHQGSVSYRSLVIINVCETTVVLRDMVANDISFSVAYDTTDSLLLPHDSLRVTVLFCPHNPVVYHNNLRIESSGGFQDVYLSGHGIPSFSAPDALYFGWVTIGDSLSLPVSIHNIGDTTLAIYDVAVAESAFTCQFDSSDSLVAPGDSLQVMAQFHPSASIWFADYLVFHGRCEEISVLLRGHGTTVGVTNEKISVIPEVIALQSPYPNPFNEATVIWYDVPRLKKVYLVIYDVLGRKVAELVNGDTEPGYHSVMWDAAGLPSGIYFVRMEAGEFVQTRKVVLLK
jgi:hypothetical protein